MRRETSVSALSALDKGLAQYNEYLEKGEPTDAMRFGSTFHAFCLENQSDLSEWTIKKQELLCDMKDALHSYSEYMRILNPKFTTNEEFIEFEYEDNIIIRSKLDQTRVFKGSKTVIICDLKTCRDTSDKSIYSAVAEYNLLTQLACYKKAVQTKYPKYKDYHFILMNCFVSKEKKPKCRLVNWSQEYIEIGEANLQALINKFKRLDELTIDNNLYSENSPIPEPLELPYWALKNYNKNIEQWI